MKFLIPFLILPICICSLNAQNSGSVYFSPVYQNWNISDDSDFNELTNLLSVSYAPSRNLNFNLVSRYSSVGGDAKALKGLSDTQFSLGYKIPAYNLILDAGISIPTGQTELSRDEFQTSMLISQSIFGMQTPNFGQGMNIFFGASYLIPVSKGFVLGAGLSYQVRSEYQPVDILDIKYKPSNEITATAGLDVKLDEVSSFTGDLTGIFYGSDEADGEKVFTAGRRILVNAVYKRYFRFNTFSLSAGYRGAGYDKLESAPIPVENEKTNPDQILLDARYLQYVSSFLNLGYNVFFTTFEKTILYYSGYKFFGAAFSPELKISPSFKIPLRVKYMTGSSDDRPDLTNLDLSIGFIYIM